MKFLGSLFKKKSENNNQAQSAGTIVENQAQPQATISKEERTLACQNIYNDVMDALIAAGYEAKHPQISMRPFITDIVASMDSDFRLLDVAPVYEGQTLEMDFDLKGPQGVQKIYISCAINEYSDLHFFVQRNTIQFALSGESLSDFKAVDLKDRRDEIVHWLSRCCENVYNQNTAQKPAVAANGPR